MHRLVLIALVVSACGSETDDRPATLDYITETILAPSCAAAECHSAFKQEVGDQFDVPSAARRSIVANSLVVYPDDAADPSGAYLIRALRVGVPSILDKNGGNVRMPYDAAMPEADIRLIEKWIALGVHGAQCVPNDAGLGCTATAVAGGGVTYAVVKCAGGDIGDVVQACTSGQVCTFETGNGQCVKP